MEIGILTISDKGARGQREDRSGAVIVELAEVTGWVVKERAVVPDEQDRIAELMIRWCDESDLDLVLSTGGTGLGPRDVTPEATRRVIDREVPGIAESMRAEGMKHTNRAMLSRGIAGLRGQSLIVNLPGSERAVIESLSVILEVLPHAVETARGTGGDCGR